MNGTARPLVSAQPGATYPRSNRARALQALAASPVGLTQSALARRLFPRAAQPYRTTAQRRAEMDARAAHTALARRKVRRALAWMRSAGLAHSVGRYTLDADTRAQMEAHGLGGLASHVALVKAGDIVGWDAQAPAEGTHRGRIARALFGAPVGLSRVDLYAACGGTGGAASGAWSDALASLIDQGDVLPTGRWVLTEAGRDLAVGGAA